MTRRYATHTVRELLRANPDGMTMKDILAVNGQTLSNLRRVLKSMPDAYIDRWEPRTRYAWAAVWCCVVPPEDCPRPGRVRRQQ